MTAKNISQEYPLFNDIDGQPLENGNIYIGTAGLAAETNQITVYWDLALTDPVTQPIRTKGGYLSKSNVLSNIYTTVSDYSTTIKDKNNFLITSTLNRVTPESLQLGYEVSQDIVTSTANGAVSIQRGSAADTDDVFTIKNGAGSIINTMKGSGKTGLGTGSPAYMLDVTENADGWAAIIQNSHVTGQGLQVNVPNYSAATNNVFSVSSGGGNTTVIKGNGAVGIGEPTPQTRLHITDATDASVTRADITHATYTSSADIVQVTRAGNSAFNFASWSSSVGADLEFKFSGDGNGTCDGAWTGGGADYAEFLESKDGLAIPSGTSVIIENGKIRAALENESPDGVISENPSMVGNGDLGWKGKYLKTDFGGYDLDENGDRKLSPSFDKDAVYVPRKDRDEWNLVGLLGQIPVLKGQAISSSWKLIKNISETVDLYLVR